MSALVAPSGECLRGEGLVWLIGAVVCSLAAASGPIVRRQVGEAYGNDDNDDDDHYETAKYYEVL